MLTRIVPFVAAFVLASSAVFAQTAQDATAKPVITLTTAAAVAAQAPPHVVRRSDSLLNGALIGAGVAVGTGLFICTRMEPWDTCTGNVGSLVKLGAVGAGIGAGIDVLIRRRVTVYESPNGTTIQAAPIVGRDARGLRLSVTF